MSKGKEQPPKNGIKNGGCKLERRNLLKITEAKVAIKKPELLRSGFWD